MTSVTAAQKVRLGIFVAVGLALLIGSLIYLAGRRLVEERDTYFIHFSDKEVSLSGMEIGSDVKYSGLRIGRVERIRLAEKDVSTLVVEISVPQGTPIAEDSLAQVASAGITGMKYIELTRGTQQARIRLPGETIPAGSSLIDELSSRATKIASQLQEVLTNLTTMTGPESSVQGILVQSQKMIEQNREPIADIIGDARKVASDLAVVSGKGAEIATQADQLVGTLNQVGNRLNASLGQEGTLITTLQQTEQLLQRVNLVVLRSENDLDVTLRNLREASANLADFSLAIRDNPSLLLNSPADKGAQETSP